jgi:hypothetical protein
MCLPVHVPVPLPLPVAVNRLSQALEGEREGQRERKKELTALPVLLKQTAAATPMYPRLAAQEGH